tara:strand:+ start:71 stop:1543 length:1473 start_codon:yes stop_codon:yes gene_type:complete
MRFNVFYKEVISEATIHRPKYIGDTFLVTDRATGEWKKFLGQSFNIIGNEPTTKSYETLLGKSSGKPNLFVQNLETGLYYLLVRMGDSNLVWARKDGTQEITGANATRIQEAAVAQVLALAINNKKYSTIKGILELFESETLENVVDLVNKSAGNFDTDAGVQETIGYIYEAKTWLGSTASSVEAIMKEFKIGKTFVVHRGSTMSNALDSKAVELANKAGAKIGKQKDKWNPSDIWVFKKNSKQYNKAMNSSTLDELNGVIDANLEVKKIKEIAGLSLKKASAKSPAKIKYFNMDASDDEIEPDEVKTAIKIKDGISTGTELIDGDNNIMIQFRNTKGGKFTTALTGTIRGKLAQGGSVSINSVWNRLKESTPKYPTKIDYYFDGDAPTKESYKAMQRLIKDAKANAKRLGINSLKGFLWDVKSFKDYEKAIEATLASKKGDKNLAAVNLHSKLQGLHLLSTIKDDTFAWIYFQASAQTDISPAFVKVGE